MSRNGRNVAVGLASALVLLLLVLYPTSTNRTGQHRRPGEPAAPAGIVQVTPGTGSTPSG